MQLKIFKSKKGYVQLLLPILANPLFWAAVVIIAIARNLETQFVHKINNKNYVITFNINL